ncbi:E3 ubiquitin-protein ligase RGLG4 isoform X2 [Rhododendron vialii]|uniref:E3 ubiquitin-protein ligase RGLG4 isoform X2 n=1 Tax=Rhododendron vialii TaxID=182163 RepID=UPI00266013B8|nr:E3 ubiquitin-protein ligase RGLG4 isoform X2 [Rhododendron vialii]
MGNMLQLRRQNRRDSDNSSSRSSSSVGGVRSGRSLYRPTMSVEERSTSSSSAPFHSAPAESRALPQSSSRAAINNKKKKNSKYDFIPDHYSTLDQVTAALRESGLESSNLILGIDFTKSNEWTGKVSFNNRSLHDIGGTPNPYEKAISIIGKTLAPFDEDNLIPCFGFGDSTTHDQEVFSFHNDHSPCHGFEEVLACYKKIVPNLRLSVVEAAVDIVEKSGGQYHILVIVADGQVTRSVNTGDGELSPQEDKTINSIVYASSYPLSIVLVGVGDGPWEDMKKFDDKIPTRDFDNFQFVNFTTIMSKDASPSEKETAFALAALMEIPFQYLAALELGLLGRVTGKAKKIVPRRPPVPYTHPSVLQFREPSNLSSPPMRDEQSQVCPICLTNGKDMAFGCGHLTCRECGSRLSNCPICRQRISSRLRVYTG